MHFVTKTSLKGKQLTLTHRLCVGWFAACLLVCTAVLWLFCCLTLAPFKIYPPALQRKASQVCLLACRFWWQWPFLLSPWIRISAAQLEAFERIGSSGKPVMIIGNHTSFVDTLIFTIYAPYSKIVSFRTLAARSLFRLPLLGTIMRSVGHIPVHFANPEKANSFSVDKQRSQAMMKAVEDHIESGGYISMFPEGQVNRGDSSVLQSFRRGGFGFVYMHLPVPVCHTWISLVLGLP